jgi:hypothetical protein
MRDVPRSDFRTSGAALCRAPPSGQHMKTSLIAACAVFCVSIWASAPSATAGATTSVFHIVPLQRFNEVREDAGSAQITVVREGITGYYATVRLRTLDRSAMAGADFGAFDQVLIFAPLETAKTITVPIVGDFLLEGNERLRLKLSAPSGGVLARRNTEESLIINDAQDDPVNDDFASSTVLPSPSGTLKGTNKGASREAFEPIHIKPRNRSVWYSYTAPGNGVAKFRVRATNPKKKFAALLAAYTGDLVGALTRQASVDDSDDSDDLVIRINAGQTYRLAVDDSDDSDDSDDREDSDDSNDGHGRGGRNFLLSWRTLLPGVLHFKADTYFVKESAGEARIVVTRSGGSDGKVSVRYATRARSAEPDVDYTDTTGELTFGPGEVAKAFTIPILTDGLFEIPKTVHLMLSRPRGYATLSRASATLRIISEDPFTPGAGKYTALILPTPFANGRTGKLSIQTTANGHLTGRLQFGSDGFELKGVFEGDNSIVITKQRQGLPPLVISLALTPDGASVSGNVFDGATTTVFAGERNGFRKATDPAPQAGRYTLLLPGDDQNIGTGFPKGDGWATMVVGRDGTARVAGVLADGEAFSAGLALTHSGEAPLYAALFKGRGSLAGRLQFALDPGVSDAAGMIHWHRPRQGSGLYPLGFSLDSPIIASMYQRIEDGRFLPQLDATDGVAAITFGEGNLSTDLTQFLKFDRRNLVSPLTPQNARFKEFSIRERSGIFSGVFKLPGSAREYRFRSVAFQIQGRAAGFFLGPSESGFARLVPTP